MVCIGVDTSTRLKTSTNRSIWMQMLRFCLNVQGLQTVPRIKIGLMTVIRVWNRVGGRRFYLSKSDKAARVSARWHVLVISYFLSWVPHSFYLFLTWTAASWCIFPRLIGSRTSIGEILPFITAEFVILWPSRGLAAAWHLSLISASLYDGWRYRLAYIYRISGCMRCCFRRVWKWFDKLKLEHDPMPLSLPPPHLKPNLYSESLSLLRLWFGRKYHFTHYLLFPERSLSTCYRWRVKLLYRVCILIWFSVWFLIVIAWFLAIYRWYVSLQLSIPGTDSNTVMNVVKAMHWLHTMTANFNELNPLVSFDKLEYPVRLF